MPSRRVERVNSLLKRELGEAIRRELPVDEAGVITVNEAIIAPDLRTARVYISILGGPDQQKRAMAQLEACRVRLQSIVAREVIIKYTPQLKFILDDSIQRGNRVLQVLEELERDTPPSPAPSPVPPSEK
jgi:ribosome-binding factor A